jgi:glycerol-3-phosphate dehydrogenase
MTNQFSFNNSQQMFDSIESTTFDLLIIGGGITGAGIALDATQRGLKVCLIEKEDYASGTSSRSTKLIHGGLRYLKQMEFKLVHDVGTERRIVYENARNLVRPEKMILPIIKKGSLSKTLTAIALCTYDFLGGVKKEEHKKMLSKEKVLEIEPALKKEDLLSGALYYEYRTDDARLCIANIISAVSRGASCFNHTEAIDFIYDDSKQIKGAIVKNNSTQQQKTIHAKVVVNACGPWVDKLRKIDNSLQGKKLQLSKGVHIVVPYEKLPIKHSVYFDTDDKRMIFCIPRQNITYIGTTDTLYNKEIDMATTTLEDLNYLLRQVNNRFENTKIEKNDVLSSWCGLRPLIYEEGKSASELSRKDEIFESASGLYSMAGGKLTGYRLMAEHLVNKVCRKLGKNEIVCTTKNTMLDGSDFKTENEIYNYIEQKQGACREVKIPSDIIKNWVYKYGRNTDKIIEISFDIFREYEHKKHFPYIAELLYTIDFEQVASISDFLVRRSAMLYFEREKIDIALIQEIQKIILAKVDLSKDIHENNLQIFMKEYEKAIRFE